MSPSIWEADRRIHIAAHDAIDQLTVIGDIQVHIKRLNVGLDRRLWAGAANSKTSA